MQPWKIVSYDSPLNILFSLFLLQINFRCKPTFREAGPRNYREVSVFFYFFFFFFFLSIPLWPSPNDKWRHCNLKAPPLSSHPTHPPPPFLHPPFIRSCINPIFGGSPWIHFGKMNPISRRKKEVEEKKKKKKKGRMSTFKALTPYFFSLSLSEYIYAASLGTQAKTGREMQAVRKGGSMSVHIYIYTHTHTHAPCLQSLFYFQRKKETRVELRTWKRLPSKKKIGI